jgi:hypothetical protein
MKFNKHSNLEGEHSFLSGSKYHWINYPDEKIISSYNKYLAVQRGVALHNLAKDLILMGIKLPNNKKSFNKYVNDAIGFRMTPECILYYSSNAFGTADTISFRDGLLRIHDLKTGVSPVSIHQLEIYASYFCLEYNEKPSQIQIELRIYQLEDILIHIPDPEQIRIIMDKIVTFDKYIEEIKKELED